jgi:hypothetical protein
MNLLGTNLLAPINVIIALVYMKMTCKNDPANPVILASHNSNSISKCQTISASQARTQLTRILVRWLPLWQMPTLIRCNNNNHRTCKLSLKRKIKLSTD